MIGGPTRYILKTQKVLNDIKTRFFKLNKLIFDFTLK